jgi:hypothetical protein
MRSSFFILALASLPLAAACSAFTGVDSDGLVPASDDGGDDTDSGRRDSGTRDSGSRDGGTITFDSGSIESMGPDCTSLQSCCDFLDTTTAATCRSTALAGNEFTCQDDLLDYQDEGYCSTITPPVDSGTVTPPPIDSGLGSDYCSLLINCCSTSTDVNCLTTALGGDESACESEYVSEILAGTCAP